MELYQPKFLGWQDEMQIDIEEVDISADRGGCKRCKRTLVDRNWWYAQSKEDRDRLRKKCAARSCRGICTGCYTHLHKSHPEQLAKYDRKTVKLADFVEDYQIYYRRTTDKHKIAELMGMTYKAWEKAYYRATGKGLL